MNKFLEELLRRKKELEAKLAELERIEILYRTQLEGSLFSEEKVSSIILAHQSDLRRGRNEREKTIQEMIIAILSEDKKLTSSEILEEIKKRWLPKLLRSSLSPQLTRLARKNEIQNDNGKWFKKIMLFYKDFQSKQGFD